MKQGNKYLYGNGRGNYWPISLSERMYIKKIKQELESGKEMRDIEKKWREHSIKAHKHGVGNRQFRKGLNSHLRQLAKQAITEELNNID